MSKHVSELRHGMHYSQGAYLTRFSIVVVVRIRKDHWQLGISVPTIHGAAKFHFLSSSSTSTLTLPYPYYPRSSSFGLG